MSTHRECARTGIGDNGNSAAVFFERLATADLGGLQLSDFPFNPSQRLGLKRPRSYGGALCRDGLARG